MALEEAGKLSPGIFIFYFVFHSLNADYIAAVCGLADLESQLADLSQECLRTKVRNDDDDH